MHPYHSVYGRSLSFDSEWIPDHIMVPRTVQERYGPAYYDAMNADSVMQPYPCLLEFGNKTLVNGVHLYTSSYCRCNASMRLLIAVGLVYSWIISLGLICMPDGGGTASMVILAVMYTCASSA